MLTIIRNIIQFYFIILLFIGFPSLVFSQSIEVKELPNDNITINEINKLKQGLTQIGITLEANTKISKSEIKKNKTKFVNNVSKSQLEKINSELTKLKTKEEIQTYINNLKTVEILALLSTIIPDPSGIKYEVISETSTPSKSISRNALQSNSLIYCYVDSKTLSASLISWPFTTFAQLTQRTNVCKDGNKWVSITPLDSQTYSTAWFSYIVDSRLTNDCAKTGYSWAGQDYKCKSSAKYGIIQFPIYGININAAWGILNLESQYYHTWWTSPSFANRSTYKWYSYCSVIGCVTR